jgi:uncharacterized protein
MIPTYPHFKKIELIDKKDVEKFTSKFPPISDFNFYNIWAWDLKGEMGLSVLNDNLAVKFTDYLNGQPLLSFLGINKINETTRELIKFSENNYKNNVLKLIPEIVVDLLDKSEFEAISDKDSRDYVYSVPHLATMNVWHQNSLSKEIRLFVKKYSDYIVKQNSILEISADEYLELFKTWSENKKIENFFELNEYKAFKRMFQINDEKVKITSLYVKDVLIGFSLFEILTDDYLICHFAKADISYHPSVYAVLNFEEAKILDKQGIKYYNWQQSLGIKGLEQSKMKYKPVSFMNKFIIKKK